MVDPSSQDARRAARRDDVAAHLDSTGRLQHADVTALMGRYGVSRTTLYKDRRRILAARSPDLRLVPASQPAAQLPRVSDLSLPEVLALVVDTMAVDLCNAYPGSPARVGAARVLVDTAERLDALRRADAADELEGLSIDEIDARLASLAIQNKADRHT